MTAVTDRKRTTYVRLTDAELAVLDGRCSPAVQAEVDSAVARLAAARDLSHLPPAVAGLVADIVNEARTNGLVTLRPARISHCRLCGTSAGYAPFKSGPNRGLPNRKRPLTVPGYEFARRTVTVQNTVTVGGCKDCVDPALDDIRVALSGVRAEIADALRLPGTPSYRKHDNRRCTKCGWEGHEGQMRRLPTIMGDGTYPGGCPDCDATNALFRTEVEAADGFTVVEG